MKWILIPLGVLVVAMVVIVIVGLLIPKTHTASRQVTYNQDPHVLWQAISDFEHHAEWRPDIKRVERLEDRNGHAVWREVRNCGDTLNMEVIEFEPPKRMITRVVDNRQFGGTWTWEIELSGDSAAALTITENGEIYNPIFRVVARFFMGYHATMDAFHKALGAKFGEQVSFD